MPTPVPWNTREFPRKTGLSGSCLLYTSSPAAERLAKLRKDSSDLKSFFQLKGRRKFLVWYIRHCRNLFCHIRKWSIRPACHPAIHPTGILIWPAARTIHLKSVHNRNPFIHDHAIFYDRFLNLWKQECSLSFTYIYLSAIFFYIYRKILLLSLIHI